MLVVIKDKRKDGRVEMRFGEKFQELAETQICVLESRSKPINESRRKRKLLGQEAGTGLSIRSISVECSHAAARVELSFEGHLPLKAALSNLLHHRSAIRRACGTLEDIANRTFEPLVRYSDSAAILIVDPSGI